MSGPERDIPDAWPPESPDSAPIVPLFPLAHVWLFPKIVLPLHVFEERYKRMVEDLLDGPGRIVLGTVEAGHENEMAGAPPVYPIAGLGEVGGHVRLDDGRFDLWLVGRCRVAIREVPSDRPYRLVRAEPVPEVLVPREREPGLRKDLIEAIHERSSEEVELRKVPTSSLADILIHRLPLPHEVFHTLYCQFDAEKRARRALAEHRVRPKLED